MINAPALIINVSLKQNARLLIALLHWSNPHHDITWTQVDSVHAHLDDLRRRESRVRRKIAVRRSLVAIQVQ